MSGTTGTEGAPARTTPAGARAPVEGAELAKPAPAALALSGGTSNRRMLASLSHNGRPGRLHPRRERRCREHQGRAGTGQRLSRGSQ